MANFRVNKRGKLHLKSICSVSTGETDLLFSVSTGEQMLYPELYFLQQNIHLSLFSHDRSEIFYHSVFTVGGGTPSSQSCVSTAEHLAVILPVSQSVYPVGKHILFRAVLLQCTSPTLTQHELSQLQEFVSI